MKTIAIFAHYNPDNKIRDYIIYYLEQLQLISDEIIFVSTSPLDNQEQKKIVPFVAKIIIRKNIGYDFHSYKTGIENIKDLANYDQLILCNDSCYGPLFSLKDIFIQMNNQKVDFWGITSSNLLKFHLQSYFLVFNKQLLLASCFMDFWKNLPIYQNRKDIVYNYEIELTQRLTANNYHAASYVPLDLKIPLFWLMNRHISLLIKRYLIHSTNYSTLGNVLKFRRCSELDKTIILWDYIIQKYKMPFIKTNIFRRQIASSNHIKDVIKQVNPNFNLNFDHE